MQAHAGHGTARIGFRPLDTIFWLSWQRLSSGEWPTTISASWKKYKPPSAVRLCHSAVSNLAEMTLKINLHELTMPFEFCVLETEWMETRGNSLRFWCRKCTKWAKKLFCHQIFYFLGGKFSCGDVLKGQHVMLTKWENFDAFLFWLLRQENVLTGDVLNEFYCIRSSCRHNKCIPAHQYRCLSGCRVIWT
jgi:hypothetical protein